MVKNPGTEDCYNKIKLRLIPSSSLSLYVVCLQIQRTYLEYKLSHIYHSRCISSTIKMKGWRIPLWWWCFRNVLLMVLIFWMEDFCYPMCHSLGMVWTVIFHKTSKNILVYGKYFPTFIENIAFVENYQCCSLNKYGDILTIIQKNLLPRMKSTTESQIDVQFEIMSIRTVNLELLNLIACHPVWSNLMACLLVMLNLIAFLLVMWKLRMLWYIV